MSRQLSYAERRERYMKIIYPKLKRHAKKSYNRILQLGKPYPHILLHDTEIIMDDYEYNYSVLDFKDTKVYISQEFRF